MAMIQQLALISESEKVTTSQLMAVSAALQKQASRDLKPIWEIEATVDAFETLEDVPLGYWPMIIQDDIGYDAAGIHLDKDGQPFALISSDDDVDIWSLTASHECLEMLVDPSGNRTIAGDSPKNNQGRVMFLVEVCDPSEAAEYGYSVNGILVSDFYTPEYFDPITATGVRYSFTDAIREPRDVLPGGYLSWLNPASGEWWQETWFSGNKSKFVNLGPLTSMEGSMRTRIDSLTGKQTRESITPGRKVATAAGLTSVQNHVVTTSRAAALRQQIDAILGRSPAPASAAGPTTGVRGPRRPQRRS